MKCRRSAIHLLIAASMHMPPGATFTGSLRAPLAASFAGAFSGAASLSASAAFSDFAASGGAETTPARRIACATSRTAAARSFVASAPAYAAPADEAPATIEGLATSVRKWPQVEHVQVDADWVPNREGHSLYIRPTMFATDAHIGVRPSETYRFFIMASPVGAYYSRPIRLRAETQYVRAIRGGTGEAKAAGNYAGALLATQEAQAAGFDQVLWMDGVSFKYIQEVGTMNMFFIIDGKIITPATDGAILKGITRNSLLHLFREKGLVVEERPITIDEIVEAFHAGKLEDAFGAGTAAVISYISEIAYGDLSITLPPVESRSISRMAKDEIEGMRSGRIADRHGWIVPVAVEVPVG